MSNFEQAKKWLREGKKICRVDWRSDIFWMLGLDESIKCKTGKTEILEIPHIHLKQLDADDWEIYINKEEGINKLKKDFTDEEINFLKEFVQDKIECKKIIKKVNLKGGNKKHGKERIIKN